MTQGVLIVRFGIEAMGGRLDGSPERRLKVGGDARIREACVEAVIVVINVMLRCQREALHVLERVRSKPVREVVCENVVDVCWVCECAVVFEVECVHIEWHLEFARVGSFTEHGTQSAQILLGGPFPFGCEE